MNESSRTTYCTSSMCDDQLTRNHRRQLVYTNVYTISSTKVISLYIPRALIVTNIIGFDKGSDGSPLRICTFIPKEVNFYIKPTRYVCRLFSTSDESSEWWMKDNRGKNISASAERLDSNPSGRRDLLDVLVTSRWDVKSCLKGQPANGLSSTHAAERNRAAVNKNGCYVVHRSRASFIDRLSAGDKRFLNIWLTRTIFGP